MSGIYHGGALDIAMGQYGGQAQDWLDLSTGINPYHYPCEQVKLASWTQLPQVAALNELLAAAGEAYQCPLDHILTANGTQFLIEQLPRIFKKSTIAILAPTYAEHAENWRKHGHEVVLVTDLQQAKMADHLLIVNPNNPTGKLYSAKEMSDLRCHFAAKNGYLIIDEAFMDLTPWLSMDDNIGEEGLIILRSFGKFFGLAGVRIGFMLAKPFILKKMQKLIGLWGISGMAMDVAITALNDAIWQQEMRKKLAAEMQHMHLILSQNGFTIVGSCDLFCLVTPLQKNTAHIYFDKLAKHHILCRKFMDDDNILRFGLMKYNQQAEFEQKLNQICAEAKK